MSDPVEAALHEANRLLSLSRKEREEHMVYASDSDLRELITALKRKDAKPLAWRWVLDFAPRQSNLYAILAAVNKERE